MTVVAFGDSITVGLALSPGQVPYCARIATAIGVDLVNLGSSGADINGRAAGVASILSLMLVTHPTAYDTVVCLMGFNDMRQFDSDAAEIATFQSSLLTGLLSLTAGRRKRKPRDARERRLERQNRLGMVADSPRVFVGNCLEMTATGYTFTGPTHNHGSDAAVAAYNVAILAAVNAARARGRRVTYVDASAVYTPATMAADNIHPNDAGHTAITNAFLGAMSA